MSRGLPRRYRIAEYKKWFPKTGDVFLRYLKRHDALGAGDNAGNGLAIGLVVTPWVSTAAPWYTIMLAIGLARRGRQVILIWDDSGFPEDHIDEQNAVIGNVLAYVGRFLRVVKLSDAAANDAHHDRAHDDVLVADLAELNLTWSRRGAPLAEVDKQRGDIRLALARALPRIRTVLEDLNLECLVVPGGVYGTSGLFLSEGRARQCRVATFDSDRGYAQVCVDGIAAQNQDMPRAFHEIWQSDDLTRRRAIEVAIKEFDTRNAQRDDYGFQSVPSRGLDPDPASCVLMPLNVEWDSAALGRHRAFSNTYDWVTTTVAAVLDADGGPIVVRQHPSERRPSQRSQLNMAEALRERFGADQRCRFVAADEPVNTYDLVRSATLVLPFVSTIAIEAAAIGKPVLISGSCYYDALGIVHSARTRDEYLDLLGQGLRGELAQLPDQSDRAWIAFYVTAVRNRLATDFTPQPDDFWRWSRRSPDILFAEPEVSDILEALDRDVPLATLRHRRFALADVL